MAFRDATSRLREGVWNGSIPLEIRLHKADCRTYDESDPYLVRIFLHLPACTNVI
jgi:autophagy-related protein 5